MGSASSISLEGMAPHDVARLELAYAQAKDDGLDGWDLVQRLTAVQAAIKAESVTAAEAASSVEAVVDISVARARLAAMNRAFSPGESTAFILAVDGSDGADLAYAVCLHELMRSRDSVNVVHAFDSTKNKPDLSESMKPSPLREKVDVALMTTLSKKRYALTWVDKQGRDTKAFLATFINELAHNAPVVRRTFFVTGYTGRKKGSSLAVHSAGKFHMPNIIVKREPVQGRPRVLVAAVKSPVNAPQYDVAVELMKPGLGDKLVVLHIYDEKFYGDETDAELKRVATAFGQKFAADGLGPGHSAFVPVAHPSGTPPRDVIVQQLAALNADYVVLAPTLEKVELTMKHVLLNAECNVVVCKR